MGRGLQLLPLCALSDVNRLPGWERGHLLAGVPSSTDASTFSSEGGSRESLGPGVPHPSHLREQTPVAGRRERSVWS